MRNETLKLLDEIRQRNFPLATDGGPGSGPPEGNQNARKYPEGEGPDGAKTQKAESPEAFRGALERAKASQAEDKQWRVDVHGLDSSEYETGYKDMDCYTTAGGSTYAIHNGDIVSVCKNRGDAVRGSELLKEAVANGGKKLDSYEGNHDFYSSHGFEAVSWCKWDDKYAPDEWCKANGITDKSTLSSVPDSALKIGREDIVFYRYTGKNSTENVDDFKSRVSASADYDVAQGERDRLVK